MPDWPSFGWGILLGGVAAFGTGFLKKAGEATYAALSARIGPPSPVQVDGKFVPNLYPPGSCAWVSEFRTYDYEGQGYSYYPYGKREARCYRIVGEGANAHKEFVMVKLGAKKSDA